MGRCRAGRAARKRRHRHESTIQSVSLCHQHKYVRLMRFLHQRGFSTRMLQPTAFTDTGRGLQVLKNVKPGQMLISLPESCLLTTSTVLNSYLGPFIKGGEASDWFPYTDVLPTSYTCPAYFSDEVMAVLPPCVQKKAREQQDAVREIHSSNKDFFRSLQPVLSQPVEDVLTYEALRWAWCSVNTRSVFMSHPSNNFLRGQDVYALAPFLDLLNHRPDVQVQASFNEVTKCYEIRSVSGISRYQQAFINYGSHDNHHLMLEYGFVAPCNPHSVVYVDKDLLADVLRGERSLEEKFKFLRQNNFLHNLTVSGEGPSWRLMTALRLLSLPQTLYHHWRAVLLGQAVCEEREWWSIRTAKTLCQRLLADTHTALEQISNIQQCEQPVREQLNVATALRQEERCILESCLDALEESQTSGHAELTPDWCSDLPVTTGS